MRIYFNKKTMENYSITTLYYKYKKSLITKIFRNLILISNNTIKLRC